MKLRRLALAALITTLVLAGFGSKALASFSTSNLIGSFTLNVHGGFVDDDGGVGQMALLGNFYFNGQGVVTLTNGGTGMTATGFTSDLTSSNNNTCQEGDQFSCTPTFVSGTYSVNPDGTGTMTLNFGGANQCLGNYDGTTNTSIAFNFVFVPGSVGLPSQIISTTFTPPVLVNPGQDSGITFPEQGAFPNHAQAQEIIAGLELSGILIRQ